MYVTHIAQCTYLPVRRKERMYFDFVVLKRMYVSSFDFHDFPTTDKTESGLVST